MDGPPIQALSRLHGALADPTRVRVMEELWGCRRSAKELAGSLGLAPDRLYYHLAKLEQAGLVEVAELRAVGRGKVERVYRPVSREPDVGPLSAGERGEVLEAMLHATVLDLCAAVRAQEEGRTPGITLTRATVQASRRRLEEYAEACRQLADDLRARPGRRPHRKARILTTAIEIDEETDA